MKNLASALLASLLLPGLLSVPARGDTLTFTLNAPIQTVNSGSTASYTATISAPATNANPVYLNGDTLTFKGPGDISFTDDLFANFPVAVNPGEIDTAVLFTAAVPLGETPGIYTGFYVLQGGADGNAEDTLGSQGFTLDITAASAVAPEPSSFLLLSTGLLFLCLTRLRSQSKSSRRICI